MIDNRLRLGHTWSLVESRAFGPGLPDAVPFPSHFTSVGVVLNGALRMPPAGSVRLRQPHLIPQMNRSTVGSMATLDSLVQDFFAQKTIAVVGVSDKRETGCNLNYRKFKAGGYKVYAVNPRLATYDGAPCYPDLKSIPERPDAVFILAKPSVTDGMVQQCVDLGIKRIWMHCLMGTKPGLAAKMTSVSASAVAVCRANGITVIPGSCPAQFLKPDPAHRLMRGLWRLLGFLRLE
jgi:uncharacterized protein